MASITDALHRTLFRTLSLLSPERQGVILSRFFDWIHRSPDPWKLSSDDYELHKYQMTLEQLPARPYRRIIEVGCSEGVFTHTLAGLYPEAEIVGVDVSERALARARERAQDKPRVRFIQADILTHEPEERFDLAFCSETLYYLGRHDRLRHASARLRNLLGPEGVLVAVHPWPEATRLHRFLDAHDSLSRVTEEVFTSSARPFAVSVYQTKSPN
ncbi:methyltransferase domain-containing protein [Nonomuraea sp. NN258]|uniref:class I SAM-dependent methyltransferase n=1 Tax=Nonomuraea antri TaxID=2730852 RepID=UPI00156A4305|nr:class I SAM-dependent methyltransferase [Nonomuraea antri]NRQ37601.1 methyltransferase domain-containing protein [Nonomuraea antri]